MSSKHPDQVFRVVDETGEEWTVFASWCMPSSSVLVESNHIFTD
jgi:hypothetical protein